MTSGRNERKKEPQSVLFLLATIQFPQELKLFLRNLSGLNLATAEENDLSSIEVIQRHFCTRPPFNLRAGTVIASLIANCLGHEIRRSVLIHVCRW